MLHRFRKAFLLYGIAIGCAAAAGYVNGMTDAAVVLTVVAVALIASYVLLG